MATRRNHTPTPSPTPLQATPLDELFVPVAPHEGVPDLDAAALAVRSRPGRRSDAPSDNHDARLEYVGPDGVGHSFMLGASTAIGRHTDNDVQLLDPEVSKAHLVIRKSPAGFLLEDLGSANGTQVNGARVTRVLLKHNDVILVGNSALRVIVPPVIRPKAVPLHSIADVRRSDPSFINDSMTGRLPLPGSPPPSAERTTVTLVPEGFFDDKLGRDSVFAEHKADVDFERENRIRDERVLRRDYERLRVAYELMGQVALETDLERLGRRIIDKIRGVLPTDSAVVMLRDPSISDDLVTLASWADRDQDVRIPRAIVERVLSTRSGLLTSDAQVDSNLRRSETVVGQRIRSALCVPLLARGSAPAGEGQGAADVDGEVLGVIHVSSNSVAGAYEEKDLALLRAIAQPAALAVANARLGRKIEEEAHTRGALSRFLSPALVEKAMRNELSVGVTGDKVQATVLFSDIRGFTTISDGAAPEQVVSMLNEYFDAMVEVVFECGGTLDKFIGDGMMAVWGTPVQGVDDAVWAVRAAARMRRALDEVVNGARAQRGEAPLSTGYGIATGRVVAGAMGARRRQDFTVIGDTVNLASRLCGQARAGQILVDESTEKLCRRAGISMLALEPRQVKGFARPVPVFELTSEAQQSARSALYSDKPTVEGANG